MKSAKVFLFFLGVFLVLFGLGLAVTSYPLSGVAVVAVLFVLAWLSDRRNRRDLAALEAVLAGLACPHCGASFGRDAASAAIHPRRAKAKGEFSVQDDFGFSSVDCVHCGLRSLFERSSHELLPLQKSNVA